MTPAQCKAESERIPLAASMMNGMDEKTARAKLEESNWDARLDWCEKDRGYFGLVCESERDPNMPDDVNNLLGNGIRAEPVLSKEAFVVRAATTDSLLPVFPNGT